MKKEVDLQFYCVEHGFSWSVIEDKMDAACPRCLTGTLLGVTCPSCEQPFPDCKADCEYYL